MNQNVLKRYTMNTDTTLQFLKEKATNFIIIRNTDNDSVVGKNKVYLSDLPNEDLTSYIKLHSGKNEVNVWIEHRIARGVTHVKSPNTKSYRLEILDKNKPVQNNEENQIVTQQQHAPVQQQVYPAQPYLANPNHSQDVLSSPLVKTIRDIDARELKKAEKENDSLKEEIKGYKSENSLLDKENRELKTKISVAEEQKRVALEEAKKEKEYALLLLKLENKSFLDSPAFEKMLEKAPGVLEKALGAKYMANSGPQQTALAAPNVSDIKKSLIDYIAESCNDVQAEFIGATLEMYNNEQFLTELQTLIERYATGN